MTNQAPEWMTIREASLALGVSELTIRRRIKDGRIAHRLENGKYYVDLNARPEAPAPPSPMRAVHGRVPTQSDQSAQMTSRGRSSSDAVANALTAESGSPDGSAAGHDVPLAGTFFPQIDLDGWMAEQSRLAEIAGRAQLLEDQLAQVSRRNEELQTGMLSLAGRNGWLESKLEERESEIKLLTDQHPRLPWWRRLFGA